MKRGRQSRPVRADELHTVAEVSDYLKVVPATVYRLAASGQMTHLRVGGHLRFTREAVLAYLHREQPVKAIAKPGPQARLQYKSMDLVGPWRKSDEAQMRRKGIVHSG